MRDNHLDEPLAGLLPDKGVLVLGSIEFHALLSLWPVCELSSSHSVVAYSKSAHCAASVIPAELPTVGPVSRPRLDLSSLREW